MNTFNNKHIIFMQRLLILLMAGLCLFSCKKNSSEAAKKTILLSHSLTNGHDSYRFYYSPDNKLIRYEGFDETPANAMNVYGIIEYDASGHVSELTTYKQPGAIALSRVVVECDATGKLKSAESYDLAGPTPNVAASTQAWTYNANGQFIKLERRNKSGKLLERVNLSYFADGSLKQTDQYIEKDDMLVLIGRKIFSIPGSSYPPGMEQIMPIFGPDFTANMVNESILNYSYDQNGVITFNNMYQMSAREYNPDSTLKKQTITIKSIVPAKPDNVVFKQYEYIIN